MATTLPVALWERIPGHMAGTGLVAGPLSEALTGSGGKNLGGGWMSDQTLDFGKIPDAEDSWSQSPTVQGYSRPTNGHDRMKVEPVDLGYGVT